MYWWNLSTYRKKTTFLLFAIIVVYHVFLSAEARLFGYSTLDGLRAQLGLYSFDYFLEMSILPRRILSCNGFSVVSCKRTYVTRDNSIQLEEQVRLSSGGC